SLKRLGKSRTGAVPSVFGGCGVVLRAGFVAKGVLGVIPVGLEVNLGLSELGLERPSVFGIERSISLGKVELERDRNLRDVRGLFRRESVPRRCRVDIFDKNGRQYGQGAAHAEADHPDFGAGLLQVLRRAANVLTCRLAEIEVSHQVLRLCGIECHLTFIEVGNQRSIAESGELVGDSLDLVIEAPPLLDHHYARSLVNLSWGRQVAVTLFPVGPFESDHLSHCCLLQEGFLFAYQRISECQCAMLRRCERLWNLSLVFPGLTAAGPDHGFFANASSFIIKEDESFLLVRGTRRCL